MKYFLQQASSYEHAFESIEAGRVNLISRVPILVLQERASLVQHALLDFDGTVTKGSQWRTMAALMPEDLRAIDTRNASWYFSHIHDSGTTCASMEDPDWWVGHLVLGNKLAVDGAWLAQTIEMYARAGLTRQQIEEAAVRLPPRDGLKNLLELVDKRAIVTFGVEQFVQAWLRHHNLSSPVAATRLVFDGHDRVERFHLNVMGAGSKGFAGRRFRDITGVANSTLLVLGDSVVDIDMMEEESFNVLIIPPSELDNKLRDFRVNNLPAMWDRITIVLADDSLEPLVELLLQAREADATRRRS